MKELHSPGAAGWAAEKGGALSGPGERGRFLLFEDRQRLFECGAKQDARRRLIFYNQHLQTDLNLTEQCEFTGVPMVLQGSMHSCIHSASVEPAYVPDPGGYRQGEKALPDGKAQVLRG